jgi:6-phosphogluconolactonase
MPMKLEVFDDADSVARTAAAAIAMDARTAITARGRFTFAVSGGPTPWIMLRDLANEDIPWDGLHIVQVDERVAPEGDPDRNLTHLQRESATYVGTPGQIIGMKTFGASAPLKELQKKFGFEPERVVAAARQLLGRP